MSDELFDRIVQQHADIRQSDEAKEGFKSFSEKRNPSWYQEPSNNIV
jgi:1,4-dihydroxy-2-naphthoyl-CoA synthase